ncbi:MAG: ClbS/DfsB family four-helix bundle protein [Anaerolineae bacterium]
MNSKQEILTSLGDVFNRWEELLAGRSEAQITAPMTPSDWSIKDVIGHLGLWQERTIARAAAAAHGGDPQYPAWPAAQSPFSEDDVEQINAWNYERKRAEPWPSVHAEWRDGFRRLLDLAERVPDQDMLAVGRYSWLSEYSLAAILEASWEHHVEHLDETVAWLDRG